MQSDQQPIRPAGDPELASLEPDRPLTGGGGYDMSKFDEFATETAEVKADGPLTARVANKQFKVRQAAFTQLLELLKQGEVTDHFNYESFLKDSNPQCAEKAYLIYEEHIAKGAEPSESAIGLLIEYGFANGKGTVKTKSQEILINCYEKKADYYEPQLLKFIAHKTPKVSASAIVLLIELLKEYGPKKLNFLKGYAPALEKVAGGAVAVAKTEAMNLYKEAIKYMGKEMVDNFTKNLKEALQKELAAFYQSWDKVIPTAPRGEAIKASKKLDVYDMVEAVDITKKFNESWVQAVLKEEKWNLKAEKITELIEAASAPKLQNGDFRPVNEMIKRLISDSNQVVANKTVKLIGCLCKGLRKNYSGAAKAFFPEVLNKLKEKKSNVIEEAKTCLQEMLYAIGIQDFEQSLKPIGSQKNIPLKVNSSFIIEKAVQKRLGEKKDLPDKVKDSLRNLVPLFNSLLGDGSSEVRDVISASLSRIVKMAGNWYLEILQAKVGKKQLARLRQSLDKERKDDDKEPAPSVKSIAQEKPAPEKTEKAQISLPRPKSVVPQQPKEAKQPRQQKPRQQKPKVVKQIPPAPAPKAAKEREQPAAKDLDQSIEDAGLQTRLSDIGVGEDYFKKLDSGSHEQRLAGYKNLIGDFSEGHLHDVLKLIKKKTKDWSQNNLNINKEILTLIDRCRDRLTQAQLVTVSGFLLNRYVDGKASELITSIYLDSFKRIPPRGVLLYLMRKAREKKTPKVLGELAVLQLRFVEVLTVNYLPVKELVAFGQEVYNNHFCKKNGEQLLKRLYEQMGEDLRALLEPGVAKALDGEFKRLTVNTQVECQLRFEREDELPKTNVRAMIEGMPRADISAQIAKYSAQFNKVDWKQRKDAYEALEKVIAENHNRIASNGVADLVNLAKNKLNDSNKSSAKALICLLSRVVESISPKDLKGFSKGLVQSLLGQLGDKTLRTEIMGCLYKVAKGAGADQVSSSVVSVLDGNQNSEIRVELLGFLHKSFEDLQLSKSDLNVVTKNVLVCVTDKIKEVREASQLLLEKLVPVVGLELIESLTKDYKVAVKSQIKAILVKQGQLADLPPEVSRKMEKSKTMMLGSVGGEQFQKAATDMRSKSPITAGKDERRVSRNREKPTEKESAFKEERPAKEPTPLEIKESVTPAFVRQVLGQMEEVVSPDIFSALTSIFFEEFVKAIERIPDAVTTQNGLLFLSFLWVRATGVGSGTACSRMAKVMSRILSHLKYPTDQYLRLSLNIVREIAQAPSAEGLKGCTESVVQLCKHYLPEKLFKTLIEDESALEGKVQKRLIPDIRSFYCSIVKSTLVDGISTVSSLSFAATVKFLKEDQQFIGLLSEKFSNKMLVQSGLLPAESPLPSDTSLGDRSSTATPSHVSPIKPVVPLSNYAYTASEGFGQSKGRQPLVASKSPVNLKETRKVAQPPMKAATESRVSQVSAKPEQQLTCNNTFQAPQSKSKYFLTSYFYPPKFNCLQEEHNNLQKLFANTSNPQLLKYSRYIVQQLSFGLQYCQLNRRTIGLLNYITFVKCVLVVVECGPAVQHSGEVTSQLVELVLNQLIYEHDRQEEIKLEISSSGLEISAGEIINMINRIMLRLVDHADANDFTLTLIGLLSKYKHKDFKKSEVMAKCIGKVTPRYVKAIEHASVSDLLDRLHHYFANYYTPGEEDNSFRALKNLLKEVVLLIGEQVWRYYEVVRQSKFPDKFIANYVISLGVSPPEEDYDNDEEELTEELDEIVRAVTNDKSSAAVARLRRFTESNPGLSLKDALANLGYNERTVGLVLSQLDSESQANSRLDTIMQRFEDFKGSESLSTISQKLRDIRRRD